MCLDSRREDKRFCTEWQQALPEFSLLLISSWIRIWFVIIVLKYLNCATFSNNLLAFFMSWFCPAFWWRDSNIYLVFSVITSRPTSFFLIGIVGGAVQLGPLGTAATSRPIVPAPGNYDDGEIGGMIGRGNWSAWRKLAPMPLCPPQIPHAARTRTWAATVGSQRLTAWATAGPQFRL
jgi:hypothetical protein